MNFTEKWLKKKIQQDKIPNFTKFRGDRKGGMTKDGGTAIYIKNGFEEKLLHEDYEESCEIVAVRIEKINLVNIIIYRLPDTESGVF